jgi:molecular chaperone IbpA
LLKRQFTLADHVEVKGVRSENGLLLIDLVREIREAMKPRRIVINGPSAANQIEAKAAWAADQSRSPSPP